MMLHVRAGYHWSINNMSLNFSVSKRPLTCYQESICCRLGFYVIVEVKKTVTAITTISWQQQAFPMIMKYDWLQSHGLASSDRVLIFLLYHFNLILSMATDLKFCKTHCTDRAYSGLSLFPNPQDQAGWMRRRGTITMEAVVVTVTYIHLRLLRFAGKICAAVTGKHVADLDRTDRTNSSNNCNPEG